MPKSKHAFLRYRLLDSCLTGNKRHTIDTLLEYVNEQLTETHGLLRGVSKRQIYEDLKYMESSEGYEAPIERVQYGKSKTIRYSSSEYSISQKGVTKKMQTEIMETVSFLDQFKNLNGYEQLSEMAAGLKAKIFLDEYENKIIQFETNDFLVGKQHLLNLYGLIDKKQPVNVLYQPYGKDESVHIISPLFLKQYNNRWFLFGWNHKFDNLSVLPLDRIISVDINISNYNTGNFIADEYFDDIIGVTNNIEEIVQSVILKFRPERFPYVASKPLHGSQKLSRDGNGTVIQNTITLNVKYNRELLSTILSFGADVEVLEPLSLRERVTSELKKLQELYG